MNKWILLLTLVIAGCSSTQAINDKDLTAEQKLKLYTTVLEATLEDGSDERCWTVMSIEVFCRKRVRDVNTERPNG